MAGGRCPPRETKARTRARPKGCGSWAGPFLPRGEVSALVGGGGQGGRAPDPGARIALAAAPLFSPDKFLRNWGVRLSSPLLLVLPLEECGFRGEKLNFPSGTGFSWNVTFVAGGRLARRPMTAQRSRGPCAGAGAERAP